MFLSHHRSNLFNQDKSGFTITEVIVAALLIAILAAGLFGAFLGANRILNLARHKVQAYNFAVDTLDRLRSNYKYEDSAMNVASHAYADVGGSILGEMATMASLGTVLTYDVAAEPQPNSYKEVTVHVNWTELTY